MSTMKRAIAVGGAVVAMGVLAGPASAQQGPPTLWTPGCPHFFEQAAPIITENPAYELAFGKQFYRYGGKDGIGPCWAPHPGGIGKPPRR